MKLSGALPRKHAVRCAGAALLLLAGLPRPDLAAADWPRFRGPNGTGVSESKGIPVEFGPGRNLAWKAKVGEGFSSPVVAAGRVFLTAHEGDRRLVLSLDEKTGAARWRRSADKVRTELFSTMNGPASSTPAADGERVFALFPDLGLIAHTRDGDEIWRASLSPFKSMHGIASSLVLAEGRVLLQVDQLEGSYFAAHDALTGKQVWRRERPNGVTGGYSTPSLYRPAAGPLQAVVSGPLEVAAYDAATGDKLWWVSGVTNAAIAVPVIHGDTVFVSEPVGEPASESSKHLQQSDKNQDGKITADELAGEPAMWRLLERIDRGFGNGDGAVDAAEVERAFGTFTGKGGLVALRPGGSGDVTGTAIRWRYTRALPYIPSVLVYNHVLFVVRDGGILTTLDPGTGEVIRQGRLEDAIGKYFASPVAADGKVYLTSEDGKVTVVEAKGEWKALATNDLGDSCHATPALGDGRIYVRARDTLYAFGDGR